MNAVVKWAGMLAAVTSCQGQGIISGTVRDASGPVAGAVVRVQTTALSAKTNERGEFRLAGAAAEARLTAFAPGYYIGGPVTARPGDGNVSLLIRRHFESDNPAYEWVSAFASAGQKRNCENCHSDGSGMLVFDEWKADAHGRSARNPRFLSMYNGTDLSGRNQSPRTRFIAHKEYGRIPLPPIADAGYYGPGFRLDFPESAGNCSACHLPAAAVNTPYETDPNMVSGVGTEGVTCDFCHKIWGVRLQANGRPYPNTPGVLSIEFRRPSQGEQLFIGPYDDVGGDIDTYSPLQKQSQICAPCHSGEFWGVEVYNSFGEWLASPYSDAETGKSCQDCHMPRRGATRIARADKGGLARAPETIFSHRMRGVGDESLLRETAKLELRASQQDSVIRVVATVTNQSAGHHIPTDHPARNMLLIVTARGAGGELLPLVRGPVIPEWGGKGEGRTDYAGLPGRGYAKILEELWTGVAPTAAYWNPTVLREDTRIPALGSDVSEYEFRAPAGGGPVRVEARLIYRRAFKTLAGQKKWDIADVEIERETTTVEAFAAVTGLRRNQ